MKPPEELAMTTLGRAACCSDEPLIVETRSMSNGCFVDQCHEAVEWAGWWYSASGARHLTESCAEHSDHHDFTPVTRFAARTPRQRLF
jgi:hypothetical protein